MSHRVRLAFYGREEYLDLPADEAGYRKLLEAAKRLAGRRRDVASHYRLDISPEFAAVIAIAEIQAVIFIEQAGEDAGGAEVIDAAGLMREPGAALYLKGRRLPVMLRNIRGGPLDDMVAELMGTRYGETDVGCVMLADGKDNPVFLVLDELQFALFSRELLDQ